MITTWHRSWTTDPWVIDLVVTASNHCKPFPQNKRCSSTVSRRPWCAVSRYVRIGHMCSYWDSNSRHPLVRSTRKHCPRMKLLMSWVAMFVSCCHISTRYPKQCTHPFCKMFMILVDEHLLQDIVVAERSIIPGHMTRFDNTQHTIQNAQHTGNKRQTISGTQKSSIS